MAESRELALVLKLVADQFQSEMKKSGGIVAEFGKFIGDWKTQLTLAGTALFAIAKSTANFGEEALKTSQRMGLTVEKTTALQYAAGLADVPVQTLERSLQTLAQRAVEASQQTGEGAKLFTALGLSATDAAGKVKPLDQLLFEVQDRLKGVGNQAEFVDAGVTAFGKGFRDLVPLLREGSAETKAAMEEGRKLGVVLSGEQARAASQFNNELKRLTAAQQGLALQLSKELIPGFTQLIATMTLLTAGPVGSLFKLEIQGWASIFTLFNHAIRETKLELDVFLNKLGKSDSMQRFWNDVLVQSRRDLDRDTEKQLHRIFSPSAPPGAVAGLASEQPGGGGLTRGDAGKEQERLAKALNEIWQTGIRGQEIEAKLFGEVMQQWEDRAAFFESHEKRMAEGVQALREYAEAEFKRDEEMVAHGQEMQQRRGQMIHESTKLEVQIYQRSLAEQQAANRTFFDEWKTGMDQYVRDTKSGFGLGADLARRTAQSMEQGFRQFFFDVWDQKIQNMADVLESLGNFAKQVLGTVFSQLATKAVLSSFGFGAPIPAFATGGSFLVGGFGGTDSQYVPIRATPGERVTVETPGQQRMAGGGLNLTFIVHNETSAEVGHPVVSQGPDGRRIVEMTIKNAVRGMIQSGDMDKSMNQRFGLSPTPGRR